MHLVVRRQVGAQASTTSSLLLLLLSLNDSLLARLYALTRFTIQRCRFLLWLEEEDCSVVAAEGLACLHSPSAC